MSFKLTVSALLIINAYIALAIPTAYAESESGCLPRDVVEKYRLYNNCPDPGPIKVRHNKTYGFIDHDGKVLIDFIYEEADIFEDGIARVAIRSDSGDLRWGAIDENGEYLIEPKYNTLLAFSEGLALAGEDKMVGYIDRQGNQIIAPTFSRGSSFENGRAVVDYSGVQQIINAKGDVLYPAVPERLESINEHLFIRYKNIWGDSEIIDLNNQAYHNKYYEINPVLSIKQTAENRYQKYRGDDTFWYQLKDSYSSPTYQLMNNKGEIVFEALKEPEDDKDLVTINGFTVIDTGSRLHVIDAQGNIRLSGMFDEINPVIEDDLAIVKQNGQYYYYRLLPNKQKRLAVPWLSKDNPKPDTIGELAFDQGFDKLGSFSEGLAFAEADGWQGFIDKSGNKVLGGRVEDVPYDWAVPFYKGMAIYGTKNHKFGVINKQGETIIPATYDSLSYCGSHFIVQDAGIGVIDNQGREIVKPIYNQIDCYDDFVVTDTNLLILDRDIKLISLNTGKPYPHKIDDFNKPKNGYATIVVLKGSQSKESQSEDDLAYAGFVDKSGEVTLIGKRKFRLRNLGHGLFVDNIGHKQDRLINSQGEVLNKDYSDFYPVEHGYIPVRKYNAWGLLDSEGKQIFPPSYEQLQIMGDDTFIVEKKMGMIDKQGQQILPPIYDWVEPLPNGFVIVSLDVKYKRQMGLLNSDLEFILAPQPQTIQYLEDGVFAVSQEDEVMALVDSTGKRLTKPLYQNIERHTDNRLRVKQQDKWGLLDDQGHIIAPPIYDAIKDNMLGLSVAKKSDKYGYINRDGKEVTEFKFDVANSFYDSEAYVEMDGTAYDIDTNGNILRKADLMRAAREEKSSY